MKKDKEWLKEEVNELYREVVAGEKVFNEEWILIYMFELIDQLDEPEKPVIPQFIADWIEYLRTEYKLSNIRILGELFLCDYTLSNERARLWSLKNETVLIDALYNDYEVEKEQWLVKTSSSWFFKNFESLGEYNYQALGTRNIKKARRFKNKSEAEAVAVIVEGTAEEVTE